MEAGTSSFPTERWRGGGLSGKKSPKDVVVFGEPEEPILQPTDEQLERLDQCQSERARMEALGNKKYTDNSTVCGFPQPS